MVEIDRLAKISLRAAIGIVMIILTIFSANAAVFEPSQHHVLSPGESMDDTIMLYNLKANQDPLLTEESELLTILKETKRPDGVYLIDYRIMIPQNQPIDYYVVPLRADLGNNESVIQDITIGVQRKAIAKIIIFFQNTRALFILGILIAVIIFIRLWMLYLKAFKRKSGIRKLAISAIIVALLVSSFVIIFESDIVYHHPGSEFQKKIVVKNEHKGTASLKIERNPQTPQAADWIKFKDGTGYLFFSTTSDGYDSFQANISIPTVAEPKTYYYDIILRYYGEPTPIRWTESFKVI